MCIFWCFWGSLKGTCLTPWSPAAPPCLPTAAGSPWKPVFPHYYWTAPPQTPGEQVRHIFHLKLIAFQSGHFKLTVKYVWKEMPSSSKKPLPDQIFGRSPQIWRCCWPRAHRSSLLAEMPEDRQAGKHRILQDPTGSVWPGWLLKLTFG